MRKTTYKRGLLLEFINEENMSLEDELNPARIFQLGNNNPGAGPVVYWMSRDQRLQDNWALLFAQQKARELKRPFYVVFCLADDYLNATIRHYGFMLNGLKKIQNALGLKNIPFYLLKGNPDEVLPDFLSEIDSSCLVMDFDPLKIKRAWQKEVLKKISIPFFEVDAHNIIPCRFISQKQEFAARTFRPKVYSYIADFLTEFPDLKKQQGDFKVQDIDWEKVKKSLKVDRSVVEVSSVKSGEDEAWKVLDEFINYRLDGYCEKRNDPTVDGQSNLSPYFHFGQLSAQRAALEVEKSEAKNEDKEAFLEELIVRKELSDNFCFYNENYDDFSGFPAWAQKTLNDHRDDLKEYVYSLEEFENSNTHDPLWNAAQHEMVKKGKMHGYMRMYWAKKILEWAKSPEDALKIAIYLNDRYELDGRDPNGYAGVSWSIGGVHDRAWFERAHLGKIRYMSYNGCKSKFDVKGYIGINSA